MRSKDTETSSKRGISKEYVNRLAKEFEQDPALIEFIINKYPLPRDHFQIIEDKKQVTRIKRELKQESPSEKRNYKERGKYAELTNSELLKKAKKDFKTIISLMKGNNKLYTRIRKRGLNKELRKHYKELELKEAIALSLTVDTWAEFYNTRYYYLICRRGDIEQVKKDFFKVKKPTPFIRNKMGYYEIKQIAISYATWVEFAQDNIYLCKQLAKKGLLKNLKIECGHNGKFFAQYTMHDCLKCVKGGEDRVTFKKENPAIYTHIKKAFGLQKFWELSGIPKANAITATFDEVLEVAKQYKTKTKFREEHGRLYRYARDNGWLPLIKLK